MIRYVFFNHAKQLHECKSLILSGAIKEGPQTSVLGVPTCGGGIGDINELICLCRRHCGGSGH